MVKKKENIYWSTNFLFNLINCIYNNILLIGIKKVKDDKDDL